MPYALRILIYLSLKNVLKWFWFLLAYFLYCFKKIIRTPPHILYTEEQKQIPSFIGFKHRKETVLFANSSSKGLSLTFKIPDGVFMKVGLVFLSDPKG